MIGKIGEVKRIESRQVIEVVYEGRLSCKLYKHALQKVYNFDQGDTVRVLKDDQVVELLQNAHGGWIEDMKKECGKVGEVKEVHRNGNVVVKFGSKDWLYSPVCLLPAIGQKEDKLETKTVPE